MSSHYDDPLSSRVYVGNLPMNVRESEVKDLFRKYGRIRDIDVKVCSRPPAFAFVEFEDPRDAAEAVNGRSGYVFDGEALRVELARGGRAAAPPPYSGGGGGRYGGYGGGYSGPSSPPSSRYGNGHGSDRGGFGGFGASRRSEYRVMVTGLPGSCSWQDLKDHMRRAGEVTFSQVMRDPHGRGVVGLIDYATSSDLEAALRKLDGSEFRNPYDTARIRVKEDRGGSGGHGNGGGSHRGRSRSRSKSRSRSRSRSESPRSRSRGRSDSRSRSRSSRSPRRS